MSQQINLLDSSLRKKTGKTPATRLAQALVTLLLVLVGIYAWAFHENQELTRQVTDAGAQIEAEQSQLDQAMAANVALPKDLVLEKKVTGLALQLKGEEAVLAILNDGGRLGNTEGYSEYMRAFSRQIVSGLWLTDFSIRGAGLDMQIGGRTLRAENVPLYIRHLNQEPATQGRVFTALEMREPKPESVPQSAPPSDAPTAAKKPVFLEFKLHAGKGDVW